MKPHYPRTKPTINSINKTLQKLCKQGVYSIAEMIDQRGYWSRLQKAKPIKNV